MVVSHLLLAGGSPKELCGLVGREQAKTLLFRRLVSQVSRHTLLHFTSRDGPATCTRDRSETILSEMEANKAGRYRGKAFLPFLSTVQHHSPLMSFSSTFSAGVYGDRPWVASRRIVSKRGRSSSCLPSLLVSNALS
eukprot:TRINITY_DN11292_c0_g1_i1.p1 TRINITY_DN11292_c0_g1~~TRINITY_DN11292_c0_g1_i1.p1  ORF type:complete len:137 (-),score=9.49 TRINITY_DN11292_c0_g1_i1:1047-1457(-)